MSYPSRQEFARDLAFGPALNQERNSFQVAPTQRLAGSEFVLNSKRRSHAFPVKQRLCETNARCPAEECGYIDASVDESLTQSSIVILYHLDTLIGWIRHPFREHVSHRPANGRIKNSEPNFLTR